MPDQIYSTVVRFVETDVRFSDRTSGTKRERAVLARPKLKAVVFKFCTKHGSTTAVLCAKFQNDCQCASMNRLSCCEAVNLSTIPNALQRTGLMKSVCALTVVRHILLMGFRRSQWPGCVRCNYCRLAVLSDPHASIPLSRMARPLTEHASRRSPTGGEQYALLINRLV